MIHSRTSLLRLRDGRTLEYATYGDPNGRPLFFFHGFMGSCHQAALGHAFANAQGLYLIAPNRPGIGKSTPMKFQTMTEYAGDIEQLADALNIESFAMIGASAGACFALACAHELPERVRLVGVAGGIVPLNVMKNLQDMRWFRKYFLIGCHGYPRLAGWLLRMFFGCCKRYPRLIYNRIMCASGAFEANMLQRREVRRMLWLDYQNVFMQPNGIQAILNEVALYFHWGFDVKDLSAQTRVLCWHGLNDAIVSWSVVRETVQHIRHCQTYLYPGGHMSFLTKVDKILLRLQHEWDKTELPVSKHWLQDFPDFFPRVWTS